MSNIKLVIEMSKDTYEDIIENGFIYDEDNEAVTHAIKTGVPLPKGHGRLCDLDAALKRVDNEDFIDCDAKRQGIRLFEWAMEKQVIIKADMESKE